MAKKQISQSEARKLRPPVKKRTSVGGKHFPLNKHKRRQFGKHLYRGQGRV